MPADRHLPRMCHHDDVPALRAMLTEATTNPNTLAGPVQVRFAGHRGWTPLELIGAVVKCPGKNPRHVLCRVQPTHRVGAEQAA